MVFINKRILKGKPTMTRKHGALTKDERLSSTTPMIHYEKVKFQPVVQESKSRNYDKQEPIPIHGAGVNMLNELDFRTTKRKKKDGVILKV
jgi:hypothetical protein